MRVVGIDPSLTATAVFRSDGKAWTMGYEGMTKRPLDEQVQLIHQGIAMQVRGAVVGFNPDLVVVEHPNLNTAYGGNELRVPLWFEIVALFAGTVPVASVVNQHRNAYLFGNGKARSKKEIVARVHELFPQFADTVGKDDNKADACAYMAMGMHRLGEPLCAPPLVSAPALDNPKIRWPDPAFLGCQEPTCFDFGSLDFGQATCPPQHSRWPQL